MKSKTNFDQYLVEQLKDEDFAERFEEAGEAWNVAIELTALPKESKLPQKEFAQRSGMTQQQISRLERPAKRIPSGPDLFVDGYLVDFSLFDLEKMGRD